MAINENIRFLFEVEDLQNTSLATVSRCGIIYMDFQQQGVEPMINNWLYNLPINILKIGKIKNNL